MSNGHDTARRLVLQPELTPGTKRQRSESMAELPR
jgi:hypothetical protein